MTDIYSLALSVGPLAIYIFVIGLMQCSRRPIVTTGAQDTAALGIAVSGFIMIGPWNLFFPSLAMGIWGNIVWLMLAMLYSLVLLLVILSVRPRIVIYGSTADSIYEPLLRAARSIDGEARIDGYQIWFPTYKTGIRIDIGSPTDTPQLVPQSPVISSKFWATWVREVRKELAAVENPARSRGAVSLVVASLLLTMLGLLIVAQPQELVAGFHEWLRL